MTTTDTVLAVEMIDPRTLLADANIRADLRLDPDFVTSVGQLGVIEPITAMRVTDGVRILRGHRRAAAAVEAGVGLVPVVITAIDEGARDRVVRQYHENTFRAALTAAEDAGVVEQLLDLGLTIADVAAATQLSEPAIASARRIRASQTATAAAADQPLTLDQAAAVAEFDTDPDAVQAITSAAAESDGQFRHELQRLRNDREEREQRDALRADLEAAGVKVTEDRPDFDVRLEHLKDAKGGQLTPENHASCPGHSASLQHWYDYDASRDAGRNVYRWQAIYFCADPADNDHRTAAGRPVTDSGVDLDAQRDERRKVREGNAAWRAARTVRREWLTGQLAAARPPKGTQRFIAAAIAGRHIDSPGIERSHKTARELLGLPEHVASFRDPKPDPLIQAIERASDGRALVIALAMVVGAHEDHADDDTWRHPTQKPQIAPYLTQLAAWGYTLSAVEQAVANGKPWKPKAAKVHAP